MVPAFPAVESKELLLPETVELPTVSVPTFKVISPPRHATGVGFDLSAVCKVDRLRSDHDCCWNAR